MQQNPLSLNEVKAHFDHWRATRPKRCKIPEYLWDKVKPLMGRYPLTAITTALSLNTNQIKENLGADAVIHFVEVPPNVVSTPLIQPLEPSTEMPLCCSIELHRTNGGILKISGLPTASLPTLIAQFIG